MTPMHAAAGATSGLFAMAAGILTTTTAGIVIFGVGIIVGLVCVLTVDRYTRRRFERDREAWAAGGGPDRRGGERRHGA